MDRGTEWEYTRHREVVSEADLEDVLSATVDVTLALDSDGTIQRVADEGNPTLGYLPDEVSGEPVESLFAADAPSSSVFDVASREAFRKALFTESDNVIAPLEAADGSVVVLSLSVVSRTGEGTFICTGHDVSDTLPEPRLSRDDLLDRVADPVFVLDSEGRFELVNDALVVYTGYDRDEMLGRDVAELLPASAYHRAASKLRALVEDEGREADTFEAQFITKDGDLILTEANLSAVTDDDGTHVGSVGVLRDIRERKSRERNLEMLTQVLTRVFRHNVRNELTIVQGRTAVLEQQVDDDLKHHTRHILDTADRLLAHSEKARLIEQVIETDELYPLDIADTVRTVVEAARDTHPDAAITVDLPPEAVVQAHPDITSAIEELVENALTHAPADSTPTVEIWLNRDDDVRTLFVEDESGGLDEHEINVLERGSESDLEHSSGVGLWLIRWLVESSEAEMIVHRTDQGSVMGIRFDRQDGVDDVSVPLAESPLARTPADLRDISPTRFRGDTVIGRVDILGQLEDIYDSLERTGGHAVLLTGEAGIGKTTLVEQFRDQLSGRENAPLIATGFCDSDIQPPYHAFRQVMSDIPSERDISEILADAAALSLEDADEHRQRKRALFTDIASEIRTVATDRPLVLLVEDMQWADSGTIDLFEYLVDEVGRWGHPILFVGTYRTSDVERTHPVLEIAEETANAGRGTVLELEAFDEAEVESLLSTILDIDDVPESFVRTVREHTGGTPLFVNELGRHLVETLEPVDSGAELPADLADLTVPDTVESAIAQRLDAVPAEVWPVLRVGAVIGREFSFDVLRLATDVPEESLIDAIDTLVRRQIWSRSAERLEFVHGLVRDRTLETVADSVRQSINHDVADALRTVNRDTIDRDAGRLATHYERAGETDLAIEWYRRAGDHARETYAQEDAIAHYERALEIATQAGVDEPDRADIYADIAETEEAVSQFDAALQTVAEGLTAVPDGTREACRLLSIRTDALVELGEYDEAQETASNQQTLARELEDRELEANALQALGEIARSRGEYDRAVEHFEDGLAIVRELGDTEREASFLPGFGRVLLQQGEYENARERFQEALEIAEAIEHRRAQLTSLHNLGVIYLYEGEFERSIDCYERCLEGSREIGDRQKVADCFSNLGINFYEQGEYDRAREHIDQAMTIFEEIGSQGEIAKQYNNKGILEYRQGNYGNARELYRESLELKRELGDRRGELMTYFNLGRIARDCGEYDTAREFFERGLSIAQDIGDTRGEGIHLIQFGKRALREGELDEARTQFEQGLDLMSEIGDPKYQGEAHRGLGRVAMARTAHETASEHFATATELFEAGGLEFERATLAIAKGRLALARGETDTARTHVASATTVAAALDALPLRGKCKQLAGQIARDSGEPEPALAYWQEALSIFEEVGAPQATLETLEHLVDIARKQDETEQALTWCRRAQEVLADAPDPVVTRHAEWVELEITALESGPE